MFCHVCNRSLCIISVEENCQYCKFTFALQVVALKKGLTLKGQCHEDFIVLGQFCAKIISLRL